MANPLFLLEVLFRHLDLAKNRKNWYNSLRERESAQGARISLHECRVRSIVQVSNLPCGAMVRPG